MKHHRLQLVFAAILMLTTAASSALAQNGPADTVRIAYENADRTAIFAKTPSSSAIDTLLKPIGTYGQPGSFRPSHVAALASTADGKSLLIACRLAFYSGQHSAMDSVECFARLDSPFTLKGAYITVTGPSPDFLPLAFGTKDHQKIFTILKRYYAYTQEPLKPLPLGVLTPDFKEWYGTWQRTARGDSVQFFHGNFDASGIPDSITMRGSNAPVSDYKMTNLITGPDGSHMYAALSENTQQANASILVMVNWNPKAGGGQATFQTQDITGQVRKFSTDLYWNIDSVFGFCMRNIPDSKDHAEIGFFQRKTRNMDFYQFVLSNSINSLDNDPNFSIPASAVPDKNKVILSGYIPGSSIEDSSESITSTSGGPYGSGGDIMFDPSGALVTFVTSSPDLTVTPASAAIYLYDATTNKSYLVQNDLNQIERQPIFMGHLPKVTPPPPYVRGVATLSKGSINFGDVFTDSTTAQSSVTLTDIKSGKIIIHSADFSGSGAAAFSLVSPPAFPATVLGGGTQNFTISFKPTAVQPYSATLTIKYRDSVDDATGPDSVLTLALSGNGVKRPDSGSVRDAAEVQFSVTLVPNPLTASAAVNVTAKTAGTVRLELVDISGRSLMHTDARMLGEGERTSFSIDAKALALAPGSYYVVLHTPLGDVMRKAIVIE